MHSFHRLYSRAPSSKSFAAAAAIVSASAFGSDIFRWNEGDLEADCDACITRDVDGCLLRSPKDSKEVRNYLKDSGTINSNNCKTHPMLLASSPLSNSFSGASIVNSSNKQEHTTIECDYAIIGHGRAGQSALRTLKRLDPTANIVIIDPHNIHEPNINQTKRRRNDGVIQHLPTRATSIQHNEKMVSITPIQSATSEAATSHVHYRKSLLLATGSRGAPPPEDCIGPDSKSRILELRSSSVPAIHKDVKQKQLPNLNAETVRSLSLMAASQGATVAVMGSGFEALELAASLARASSKPTSSNDEDEKVILLFGNSGPLSSRLPRYLSAAISKRLRQCGITVEERSMTRYLSMENLDVLPRLEIYTVKSYDRLDSRRLVADLLVLAPGVGGMSGTAVLPTSDDNTSDKTGNNYQPWSSLVFPPLITCYLEDGRVATNSEFLAASSIYAAGSVAKYPNGRTGQADVAGGDHMSAELSGEIAAKNMAKESLSARKGGRMDDLMSCHVQETIPVWRSDQVPYLPNRDGKPASTMALYSMGIHALCVGKCDSTSMATHGFWWTNTNNQNGGSKNEDNPTSESKVRPNAFMRRMTRKATNIASKSSFSRGGSLPVYGSGVVFYLDQCGSIQGVMLWGLPFSNDSSDVQSDVNDLLVERMKDIIRTNGGVAIREHSENIVKESYGVTMDVDLLSFLHLSEETKYLASMALTGSGTDGNNKPKVVTGKPLHRYTPWKPSETMGLGQVRRKDDMGQLARANDLFYMNLNNTSPEEPIRPPSLKRIYTMQGEATWISNVDTMQLQLERSRPPKEEPLWLRQNEEWRFVNKKEAMTDAFIQNMMAGQFSDGSEAVRQAPVPQIYLDAKEQLRSWTMEDKEEDEVAE